MMGEVSMTLTDEIYQELVEGLKTGLDWTHFIAKHGASKGPLYNAIGRFFHDMEPKVKALSGETPLAALDRELERQLKQIELLEADLFFRRLRLAGLKSAKDAVLRELTMQEKEDM